MHGSRPDLFQLRQLIFTAVVITGAIAIIAAVALCSGSGFSQSSATAFSIARMDVGWPLTDFQFARTGQVDLGKWIVVNDDSFFAGRAIEQSSVGRTDYRFPLAIFNSVVGKNVDVSVKFKLVAGHVDQARGVAVRVLDGENYHRRIALE
jgi:hypothetical protein